MGIIGNRHISHQPFPDNNGPFHHFSPDQRREFRSQPDHGRRAAGDGIDSFEPGIRLRSHPFLIEYLSVAAFLEIEKRGPHVVTPGILSLLHRRSGSPLANSGPQKEGQGLEDRFSGLKCLKDAG